MQGSNDVYGTRTFRFVPAAVNIVRGGTVTWTNSSGETHNVTFDGSGAPADIADHASGTNSRAFGSTGTFGYDCTNHPGMTGTVTVQ
jgi:plastocyanin